MSNFRRWHRPSTVAKSRRRMAIARQLATVDRAVQHSEVEVVEARRELLIALAAKLELARNVLGLLPDDFAEMSVAVEGFASWAAAASYDSLVQARVDLWASIDRHLTREAS